MDRVTKKRSAPSGLRTGDSLPRRPTESTLQHPCALWWVVCFDSPGAPSRTFGSMLTLSSIRWVFIVLTFSGCSLLWSGTVSLPTSIAFWCGMTIDVATVLLLLRSGPVPAVSHSLMKGFIWSTCCLALIEPLENAGYIRKIAQRTAHHRESVTRIEAYTSSLHSHHITLWLSLWLFASATCS
jgi:hypothetical protein